MFSVRRAILLSASIPLTYSASTQISKYTQSKPQKMELQIKHTKIHEPIHVNSNTKPAIWQQTEDRLFKKLLSMALDTNQIYDWNTIKPNTTEENNTNTNSPKHEYTITTINDNETPIQFVRSECIVSDFSPTEYFQFLANANNFCKWEIKYVAPCTKTDTIKTIDNNHSILYGVYKAPASFYGYFNVISPRDFQYILARKYIKNMSTNEEICINFMYSIDKKHKLYVSKMHNNECVRSEFMGMYMVQKLNDRNECKLITILCGDAKGWIPQWLNNQLSMHTVQMIQKFKDSIPWIKSIINKEQE